MVSIFPRPAADGGARPAPGVDAKVIMQLCGWETDAMFRRYNIVDEIDLAESVAKRFANGQTTRGGAELSR